MQSLKIIGVEEEQTTASNIYALGDCLHNPKVGAVLELTECSRCRSFNRHRMPATAFRFHPMYVVYIT